jgi:hypothetical protein
VRQAASPLSSSGSPNTALVTNAQIHVSLGTPVNPSSCVINLSWTDGTAIVGDAGVFVFLVTAPNGNTIALPVYISFAPAQASCTIDQLEPANCLTATETFTDPMFSCLSN